MNLPLDLQSSLEVVLHDHGELGVGVIRVVPEEAGHVSTDRLETISLSVRGLTLPGGEQCGHSEDTKLRRNS